MGGFEDLFREHLSCTDVRGTCAVARKLQRAQQTTVADGRGGPHLRAFAKQVRDVASQLGLCTRVVDRAMDLTVSLEKKGKLPRKETATVSAVIFMACREEGVQRTINDLVRSICPADHKEKALRTAVLRCVKRFAGTLQKELCWRQDVEVEQRVPHMVTKLQLTTKMIQPSTWLAQRAFEKGRGGKNPCAVIAASLYVIAYLTPIEPMPKIEDVAATASVSAFALRDAFGQLRRWLEELLPKSFEIKLQGGLCALPRTLSGMA
jgi:transcription initiation factor TFIIIB Brf1 subunit/transcription initiation factor TFIIB